VYTPRKAMSAVIAAEAMRRLPRLHSYGGYPENTHFGDFHVSYEKNLGELAADDAFLYAGSTETSPPHPERLRRIAGVGSSPMVRYGGTGSYFLDKIRDGLWRLEVYPDAEPVRDPYAAPNADVIVTRAIWRSAPLRVLLPDLGQTFTLRSVTPGAGAMRRATNGEVDVAPGVYVLSAAPNVDPKTLPASVGAVRFDEFHAPPRDTAPVTVVNLTSATQSTSRPVEIVARIVDLAPPRDVRFVMRAVGSGFFRWWPMQMAEAYEYRATIPADSLTEGRYEYAIVVSTRDSVTTFPSRLRGRPGEWNFRGEEYWPLAVVSPATGLTLFEPLGDAPRLAFTRIGDAGRRGIFRTLTGRASGAPVFHLELPVFNGRGLRDYTASVLVTPRLTGREADLDKARGLRVRLRGLGPRQQLHVTLVERDGTSWSTAITTDSSWHEQVIPLDSLAIARSVLLPQAFPGDWNYWIGPATGRGAPNDHLQLARVERLQLSLRDEGQTLSPGSYGVEIESILITFD
jgi:hypothetical protein